MLLLAQAACALLGLGVLGRWVLPALAGANPGGGVLPDVWVPLAIVGPMLVLTGAIGDSVEGTGWIPIAAPVCVGLVGVGAALAWSAGARPLEPPARMLATAAGAGVVFLLLGAVDELAIWTGQCVFALAIVVLWINTPYRASSRRRTPPDSRDYCDRSGAKNHRGFRFWRTGDTDRAGHQASDFLAAGIRMHSALTQHHQRFAIQGVLEANRVFPVGHVDNVVHDAKPVGKIARTDTP